MTINNGIGKDRSLYIYFYSVWEDSCSNRDDKFSDDSMRLVSLEGLEYSQELSMIGGYKDELQKPGLISCFKCGLLLNAKEIEKIAAEKRINFLNAGWFFHAHQHPWCKFLQDTKCKLYVSYMNISKRRSIFA